MKRNAFGQLIFSPALRFAGEGGEGGGGGEGDGTGGNDGADGFKPPASQDELNRIIADRVARAERSAREDERRKLTVKPTGQDGDSKAKPEDKPAGVSEDDVDKRITDALAAERLELALERVNDGLDKALDGRTYAASKLFNLDRKQFVKEDGKTVDGDKLQKWVEDNSAEVEQGDGKRRRSLRGQGERDSNATGGSVSAGRDLYDENHQKKSSGKD